MVQTEVEEKSESIEEMLRQIKKIMSEDMAEEKKNEAPVANTEEVLELSATAIVEEVTSQQVAEISNNQAKAEGNDVLEKIDNLLDQKKEPILTKPESTEKNQEKKEETPVPAIVNEEEEDKEPAPVEATKQDENSSSSEEESQNLSKKEDNLISNEAAEASSEAIKTLIKTVEKPISDGLGFKSGTTMEQLVIELIKPKLSKWLDENLPNIVKHVVEKEVKKLIPRD